MCFVSMVHQYHQPPNLPFEYWTPKKYDQFKDLLKVAEEYDEKTGQKDCLDPKKADFLKDVEKLLEEKYGISKKFDWEVGDSVTTKKEKGVISDISFMKDITLRAGLEGKIARIEHHKTQITVHVLFDVISQWVVFQFDVNTIEKNDELINNSSYFRKFPYGTVNGGNSSTVSGISGTGYSTAKGIVGGVMN
jgi:hypothetical protein